MSYHFQELKLKMDFEKELVTNLRRQAEVHADHIEEIVTLKDNEANRRIERALAEKVDDAKINYNRQLAKIIGRMKGLDAALRGFFLTIHNLFKNRHFPTSR